ncbi:MAG: 50S ribosomal protein L18 [candidate division Zixibacteria bacterium]|nr:50S ribosomal protein L18 [candidate division Zixibacteria bacterium]
MAIKTIEKSRKLQKRRLRSKRKMVGTAEKPRLLINKTLKHIYAQLVDDVGGTTLCGVSDLNPDVKGAIKDKDKKSEVAFKVGGAIAELAKEKSIEQVIFDRGGFPYRGRVKALAEGARKGGLKF